MITTILSICITVWLVSILYVEWAVGLKQFLKLLLENADEEFKDKAEWNNMSQSAKEYMCTAIMLVIMPYIAIKLMGKD